jgi:hypothetical protein
VRRPFPALKVQLLVALVAIVAVAALAAAARSRTNDTAGTSPTPPLVTGLDFATGDAPATAGMARIASLHGTMVRLLLRWQTIAPAKRPASFDPRDPGDPAYNWSAADAEVEAAHAAGLQPVLTILTAPNWAVAGPKNRAQDGPLRPSVSAYSAFVAAATHRYSGRFKGLPRVRYWEAWNEPNVSLYLMPQYEPRTQPVSFIWYRKMLDEFTKTVHATNSSNVAIAGALAPFSIRNQSVESMGPLLFLRGLLCLTPSLQSACSTRVALDAVSVHPYTSGNATHHALNPNDLSLGDLPKLKAILAAADRLHHIVHPHPLQTWITEFSWDSKPPDPKGVPVGLEARWVAEALYQSWRNGITHFFWLTLHDLPLKTSDFQSGLYFDAPSFAAQRPKPAASAFSFPFVAYQQEDGTASVWGRAPSLARTVVRIEKSGPSGWTRVASITARANGIFVGSVPSTTPDASLRAVDGSAKSRPFSLKVPPDYPVDPFGATSTG